MNRHALSILALCLVIGCGNGQDKSNMGFDGSREFLPPTVVRLPYKCSFGKADVIIDIQAIPGRADAVQVEAHMDGLSGHFIEKWIQEGCSVKQFRQSSRRERFEFSFLEMHSSDEAVSELKLSIVHRFNYGDHLNTELASSE